MLDKIKIFNNKLLRCKYFKFYPMFFVLNILAYSLIFLIAFLLYFPPSRSLAINNNQILNFGFYWINVNNGVFGHLYINWISIILSIFSILYVFYSCFFYWLFWNKKWSRYISNSKITAFLILSGIIIIGGVIVGFINSPFLDFASLNPSLGLDNSNILEGTINYNFIYNCNFVKDNSLKIISDKFSISEYGILLIVFQSCLIFSLLVNTIIIVKRKK